MDDDENQITKLTIPRSRWRRGGRCFDNKHGLTLMLNAKGNQCCLGHLCSAADIDAKTLVDAKAPDQIFPWLIETWLGRLLLMNTDDNSEWARYAIEVNDDMTIKGTDRESALIDHFAKVGIELEFVDE